MKLRVQAQDDDQRQPGETLSKRTCLVCKVNKEDAVDHTKWRKLIKDVR